MLSSLAPVGESTRNGRWTVTAGTYVVGAALGGAATGAVLAGGLRPLVLHAGGSARLLLLAAAAAVGVATDLLTDRRGRRLPGPRRQVDRAWLDTYRGWVYGGGFGLQLGLGWTTVVPRSVTYAWMAAAALSGAVGTGIAIGVTYGLVRSLPLLLTAPVRTGPALRELHRRLDVLRRPVDTAVMGAQALVAVVAVGGAAAWS